MNQMKSLMGEWRGYFEYGIGYQPPQFGSREEFKLLLNGGNDEFSGICIENNIDLPSNNESKIVGFVDDGLISFKKIYENTQVFNKQGGSDLELGKENEVHYFGEYDEKSDTIYGYWEISLVANGLNEDHLIGEGGGIWKCERAD